MSESKLATRIFRELKARGQRAMAATISEVVAM